jgi:predicted HNH restriction endonuclease|tara:strand:- start:197 stop:643 length:447 start_codon:yes stop_codon:yes gene_type:complete
LKTSINGKAITKRNTYFKETKSKSSGLSKGLSSVEYQKQYTELYKVEKNERDKARRLLKKKRAITLLGGKCVRCKLESQYTSIYDFHHTDPFNKGKGIKAGSDFMRKAWERIETELKKCILLCANCHRIEHSNPDSEFNILLRQKGTT